MARTSWHPLSKLPRHTNGRTFGHCVRFRVQQAPYMEDLQWNRVSNLRPSGPEVETLPLGHSGLHLLKEQRRGEIMITLVVQYLNFGVHQFS
ncbi:hypothetical protein AVEN_41456-1 [Araneus ventricosus]|uniref:Uncharacterized protein n=1 Tax=Araneus ventricosus TaxID=182803 RepID=A0A4Y2F2Z0_ARAVE|nr:hypothetical protein AVEN_41456-1 [Araneus ventricosus]